MTLWVCLECGTKYAVGLYRCPRCHGTEFVEDGQLMPKITRENGPSHAEAEPGQPGYQPDVTAERPAGNASTEAWRGYVEQLEGSTSPGRGEELDRMSRADLIDRADTLEGQINDGRAEQARADEAAEPAADGRQTAEAPAGEEEPSPGSSSETSSEKQQQPQRTSGNANPQRARTTGSRSSR